MLLLAVAKATVGVKKVQQICDSLLKLLFYNGPNLFPRLNHDELGHDEHLQEIGVLTGSRPASMSNIHTSNCIWLRVPGLQPEKLCTLLNEYEALFQAELKCVASACISTLMAFGTRADTKLIYGSLLMSRHATVLLLSFTILRFSSDTCYHSRADQILLCSTLCI